MLRRLLLPRRRVTDRDRHNGSVPLSSNVVAERPAPPAGPETSTLAPRRAAVQSGRAAAAVLSLAAAALAALAVHLFLPNGQKPAVTWADALPPWLHPYPAMLEGLLAAAALLAAAQWAWRPLRPWTLHYAPLAAGAVLFFAPGN